MNGYHACVVTIHNIVATEWFSFDMMKKGSVICVTDPFFLISWGLCFSGNQSKKTRQPETEASQWRLPAGVHVGSHLYQSSTSLLLPGNALLCFFLNCITLALLINRPCKVLSANLETGGGECGYRSILLHGLTLWGVQ